MKLSAQYRYKQTQTGVIAQVLLVVVGFVFAFVAFTLYAKSKPQPTEKPVQAADTLRIPPKAVQLSACIPYMGEHWVELANIPKGPYYVTNKGKVIGIEYMFRTNDIPGDKLAHMSAQEAGAFIKQNNLTLGGLIKQAIPDHIDWPQGATVKTWDIEWSGPHTGLLEPHYDLHYFFITKAELNNVCPEAAFGSETPPEMKAELKRLGVPLTE